MNTYLKLFMYLFILYGCSEEILDTEAPFVAIQYPQDMASVWDSVNIECEAYDNNKIKFIELWVNGEPEEKIYKEPYRFNLYVNRYGHNSLIQLKILAYNKDGNGTYSKPVKIHTDRYLESKILYIFPASSFYQDLYLMDIDGQNKRQVTNQMRIQGPAYFSTDGRKITFWNIEDQNIYIVDSDGENLKSLFHDPRAYFARLSSAKNLVYYDHGEDDGTSSLYFYDISRGIKIKIIDHDNDIEDLAISPDGERIACIAKNSGVFLMDWDGQNKDWLADGYSYYPISFSPTGLKILYELGTSSGNQVFTAVSTGKDIFALTDENYGAYSASFSPDENKIVFIGSAGKSLYIINSDGSNLKEIYTSENDRMYYPQLTDKQNKIIFNIEFNTYSINIDGTGLKRIATNSNWPQLKPYSRFIN